MTGTAPAADYPLYFRDGDAVIVWSFDTCGVQLDARGITFTTERETRTILFSEMRSIRLQTVFLGSDLPPMALCEIRFRRFRKLTIYSGTAYGGADENQRKLYRDFVLDLHRRIPAAERARIAFHGGLTETRHTIVSAAMLAGAVLFGVLPFVLLFIAPTLHTLGVAVAAWGLAYAGWKSWKRNRPRAYAPDRISDDLLP